MEDLDLKKDLNRKKRFLKRYRKNRALIDRLENKLAVLDDRRYKVKSPTYSDIPKGGVPVTDAELLSDKVEIENRINNLVQKGKILKSEILEKIDELDDPLEVEVLESFFIDCKDLDIIADELGYTTRHISRVYGKAISRLSF